MKQLTEEHFNKLIQIAQIYKSIIDGYMNYIGEKNWPTFLPKITYVDVHELLHAIQEIKQ